MNECMNGVLGHDFAFAILGRGQPDFKDILSSEIITPIMYIVYILSHCVWKVYDFVVVFGKI